MTENVDVKMTVDTGQATQSTNNYKKTLKELKDQMVELEVSTKGLSEATDEQKKQYLALQEQAASITDALGDVNSRVKTASDDFRGMSAALEGLKGGIGALQGIVGATELLGLNNDGIEKAVKTMMSLQSIMSSINAVQEVFNKDSKVRIALTKLLTTATVTQTTATEGATIAQKAMNIAMNAMPILAIVSAAALLITALTKIAKKNKEVAETTDEATEAQKNYKAELDKINLKYSDIERQLNKYLEIVMMGKEGTAQYNAALKEFNNLLGVNVKNYDELSAARRYYVTNIIGEQKKIEDLQKQIEAENENTEHRRFLIAKLTEAQVNLTAKLDDFKKKFGETTKATKQQKVEVEELTEETKKYADELVRVNELHNDQTADVTRNMGEQYKIREAYMKGDLASVKEYSAEWLATNKAMLDNQKEADIAALNDEFANGVISKDLLEAEKYRIEEEYKQQQKELEDEHTEYLKQKEEEKTQKIEEEEQKRLDATQQRLETVGGLMQTASNFVSALEEAELAEYEGNEKKQKEIKKKYATAKALTDIAQIGVQTALGIMSVWPAAMQLGPIAGPILGGVLSALIGATGIAQTIKATQEAAKIKQAKYGAFVVGPSHSEGGVQYELEGGEAVLNKRAMAIPEYRAMASAMNVSTGGVAFPNTRPTALTAQVDEATISNIVRQTVAGITAIPVVVSEGDITSSIRNVSVLEGHSRI